MFIEAALKYIQCPGTSLLNNIFQICVDVGLLVHIFSYVITGVGKKTHCGAGPQYIRVGFLKYT